MTSGANKEPYGLRGKVIGGAFASVMAIIGLWGWIYLLMVAVEGGGITAISATFFTIGATIWLVFWGGALAILHKVFDAKNKVTLVMYVASGLMLAAAILTPIVAGL